MFLRLAAVCAVIWQASGSEASPDLVHSPLSLRLNNRRVVAQPERAVTRADAAGSSFRIKGGIEDGGRAELLVIPKDAKGDDVLLSVSVQVEKMGPRKQDMWIRRVQLHGKWLKQKWAFKTGSGFYGTPELYLARYGDSEWTAPVNLLKASDGLLSVAIHDKPVPTQLFQSSTAQDIQLVVGPVIVGVVWKTSNKDGANFNHLDVHLAGLSSVQQTLGGLLIGEPDPEEQQVNRTSTHSHAHKAEESPEGMEEQPEGMEEMPEGMEEMPEEMMEEPDGMMEQPDGMMEQPDGMMEQPEGMEEMPEDPYEATDTPTQLLQAVRSGITSDYHPKA